MLTSAPWTLVSLTLTLFRWLCWLLLYFVDWQRKVLCNSFPSPISYHCILMCHIFMLQQCCRLYLCNRHWHSEVGIVRFCYVVYGGEFLHDVAFLTWFLYYRKKITYLTPSAGELPSKYLILGTLTWLETWADEHFCNRQSFSW